MENWEGAELGGQEQAAAMPVKEPEMTTDDLVLMVGEATINKRHADRIVGHLRQQIATLQQIIAKEMSIRTSMQERINILEVDSKNKASLDEQFLSELRTQHEKVVSDSQIQIKDLETQIQKLQEERHQYVVSLEDKLHEMVIKQEGLLEEIERLKQENECLQKPKKGRKVSAESPKS